MARIPQYTDVPSADTLRTHNAEAQPGDFGGNAGILMGEAERQAGAQIYDVAQQQEVSQVRSQLAQKRAQWTVQLQQRANSPDGTSPDFADRFNADLDNDMAQMGNHYATLAGRRAFAEGSAELTSAMSERAGVYQAQAAGKKAIDDYQTGLQANRMTVLNDPSQFNSVLRDTLQSLDDPDGPYKNMPAEKREDLRKYTLSKVAESAAEGEIRMNPQMGQANLLNGKWDKYLNADDANRLDDIAQRRINSQAVAAQQQDRLVEKAAKAQLAKTDSDMFRSFMHNQLTVNDVLNLPDIPGVDTRPLMEHYVDLINTDNKMGDKIKTDPTVYKELFDRIHEPDLPQGIAGPSNKITDPTELDQYFGKGLDMNALGQLRNEVAGRRTADGAIESDLKKGMVKVAEQALTSSNPLAGIRDPKGDEQLQRFMSYFLPEYDKQRAAGKTPLQLLNPDSPDYLGKAVHQYSRTPQQIVKDLIEANAPPAALPDAVKGATQTATDKAGNRTYLVNGKWLDAKGGEVK